MTYKIISEKDTPSSDGTPGSLSQSVNLCEQYLEIKKIKI